MGLLLYITSYTMRINYAKERAREVMQREWMKNKDYRRLLMVIIVSVFESGLLMVAFNKNINNVRL